MANDRCILNWYLDILILTVELHTRVADTLHQIRGKIETYRRMGNIGYSYSSGLFFICPNK